MSTLEEKPNKSFLNLENSNFISKNIKITEPNLILEEMRVFYEDLYTKKYIIKIEESIFNNYKKT